MPGLGLFPVEDVSSKALQGMGQAAQSYGAMGQERQTKTTSGFSFGGALGGAAGGAIAGASAGSVIPGLGTMAGGIIGAIGGAASNLF
ncbi:hypothetical protein [Maridesulfovibrio bastinii]|uniref:hypothetical protein n=1 Tax=Maridesulfovibrio bastinii TaxID=47157 RepID=UPI0004146794|nr:hypothetical protein [Maridesulfovibrio bastinii]